MVKLHVGDRMGTELTFETVKESLDFPVVVVDTDSRIAAFNGTARKIFRFGRDDRGRPLIDSPTLIDLPHLHGAVREVIRTGEPSVRQIDTEMVCYQERIVPYRNDEGHIGGAVLTYLDNTECRRTEAQLRMSGERWKLAVEGANAGIWDWDIAEDTLYCSAFILDLLKIPEEEVIPSFELWFSRIHEDDRADVEAILRAHLQKDFGFDVECRMYKGPLTGNARKSSTRDYVWVQLRGQAVRDLTRSPIRMTGALSDITKRRMIIDRLTESNQALERFAYICSHDLKEPARLTQNFADLLADVCGDVLDTDGWEYLKHIRDNADRMTHMIQDMLVFAQTGHKATAFEETPFEEVIEESLKNLRISIEEKGADIACDAMPTLAADRSQVIQLFQNLIGNAIKFCTARTPRIRIGAAERDRFWLFSVADNGIGIAPEHRDKVFNAFQRLNYADEYPGTGIGLSICHKIVSRHGGRIWVESDFGHGATFFFTIPKRKTGARSSDTDRRQTVG